MANEQNLKPFTSDQSHDEAVKNGSKGGVASGKARRGRRMIADIIREILDEPLATGSDQTKLDGISIKAVKKIFDNPDIRDVKILAELLGELKTNPANTNNTILNINSSAEGAKNIRALAEDKE